MGSVYLAAGPAVLASCPSVWMYKYDRLDPKSNDFEEFSNIISSVFSFFLIKWFTLIIILRSIFVLLSLSLMSFVIQVVILVVLACLV